MDTSINRPANCGPNDILTMEVSLYRTAYCAPNGVLIIEVSLYRTVCCAPNGVPFNRGFIEEDCLLLSQWCPYYTEVSLNYVLTIHFHLLISGAMVAIELNIKLWDGQTCHDFTVSVYFTCVEVIDRYCKFLPHGTERIQMVYMLRGLICEHPTHIDMQYTHHSVGHLCSTETTITWSLEWSL